MPSSASVTGSPTTAGTAFEPAFRQASAVRNDNPHPLGHAVSPGVGRVRNGSWCASPGTPSRATSTGFRSSSTVNPFRSRSTA